ncbi:MAG: hypothetical protein GY754_08790 [bacterium]|nr:hypothetical protein [bacterium]
MNNQNFLREQESFSINIKASADSIFPLACPVEEEKWIHGWDYNMIFSISGKNENNCIFSEEMSAGHVQGPEKAESTFWNTTLYNKKDSVVHFLLVRSLTVSKLEITMKETGSGETEVIWSMTMTAVSEEGNSLFDETVKGRMKLMLGFLANSLKHYCETGTMLVPGS